MNIKSTTELVINWHITEACNYSCKYCYAHWAKPKQRELLHNEQQIKALLTSVYESFKLQNDFNSLSPKSIRLNIAGGEPLLYPEQVLFISQTAHKLGMKVSIISNASRLTFDLIENLAPYLSWFGLSMDSSTDKINQLIGRVDNKGRLLNINDCLSIIKFGQKINPCMALKINTVVNQENYLEDMTEIIKQYKPSRWKVLRMLPVLNSDLAISDQQFHSFINQHDTHKEIMRVEDNDEMSESYIMIDPIGRFFQNQPASSNKGYVYSSEILEVGVKAALNQINFSSDKFLNRYKELSA
jgi:radical S-adenosyl methionine domain-containing protein 2